MKTQTQTKHRSQALEKLEEKARNTEAFEKIEEKAHEEKSVHGHEMPAADIFKFVGLIAFFAIMIVAVIALWPTIHELVEGGGKERVIARVQDAGPWGFVVLLVIQFLQVVVAFIPGEVVQVVAGMIYGPWLGALIIWLGCLLSSAFVFLVVHKLGAPFVQAMVSEEHLEKFRKWETSPKFDVIVFILFLIPGLPKDVFTYITPLTDMPMQKFMIITNVARIPGIVMSTYAASGIIEGDYVSSAIIFAITAVIAIIALVLYTRKNNKKVDSEEKAGGES